MPKPDLNYEYLFQNMPVAQMVTRHRVIVDCSEAFARMFRLQRSELLQHNVRFLYPTQTDFEMSGERVQRILAAQGQFMDSRMMRRASGELFWVEVEGYTENRTDPYAEAFWVFHEARTQESAEAPSRVLATPSGVARGAMTARERDVAALLIQNLTAKEIGKALGISHRTVEIHRSRLLKKFNADNTRALIGNLLL
ncbi:PAS and helix-turn-helix domain-containing protein [Paracandidimonas soli]|uniref:LuxR family transcriptional regulator n=1 Tax=Paracandidimonas soli TaxID=1917182 RepID=A0A4R3VIW1_9BURK|nr:PAS and helix-turn-helix domain-containing protein [Paracandidimonas soli]TCV02915.1 LuxR family transcriptional regulator [Paracandidimonas soli]